MILTHPASRRASQPVRSVSQHALLCYYSCSLHFPFQLHTNTSLMEEFMLDDVIQTHNQVVHFLRLEYGKREKWKINLKINFLYISFSFSQLQGNTRNHKYILSIPISIQFNSIQCYEHYYVVCMYTRIIRIRFSFNRIFFFKFTKHHVLLQFLVIYEWKTIWSLVRVRHRHQSISLAMTVMENGRYAKFV